MENNCEQGPVITVLDEMDDGCSAQPLSCDSEISSSLDSEDCTTGPRGSGHYAEKYSYNGMMGDRLFLNAELVWLA